MFTQLDNRSEDLSASGALRLVARMNHQMDPQIVAIREGFGAVLAHIRFFTCVNSHVVIKVDLERENHKSSSHNHNYNLSSHTLCLKLLAQCGHL